MISISPQQPKQQYMAKYWSDTLNLSPRMNQESVQPYSATKLYRGVRQPEEAAIAYQAFILRSHNATLNFPEHFVNKEVELHDETDASSSLDQKQPETLLANKVNLGSNEVAVSDGGVEDGMAEAWLNAVTSRW
ncbi:hypothetical protein HID58_078331, partial [Brassica napus]